MPVLAKRRPGRGLHAREAVALDARPAARRRWLACGTRAKRLGDGRPCPCTTGWAANARVSSAGGPKIVLRLRPCVRRGRARTRRAGSPRRCPGHAPVVAEAVHQEQAPAGVGVLGAGRARLEAAARVGHLHVHARARDHHHQLDGRRLGMADRVGHELGDQQPDVLDDRVVEHRAQPRQLGHAPAPAASWSPAIRTRRLSLPVPELWFSITCITLASCPYRPQTNRAIAHARIPP